jgi:hypothetical protein
MPLLIGPPSLFMRDGLESRQKLSVRPAGDAPLLLLAANDIRLDANYQ